MYDANKCTSLICLDVNCYEIIYEGLQNLPKAILKPLQILPDTDEDHSEPVTEVPKTIKAKCAAPCQHIVIKTLEGKQHLFIDTDFFGQSLPYSTNEQNCNRKRALEEWQFHLKLASNQYHLLGVIEHRPGHYVAYVRNLSSGRWLLHDDMTQQVT